MEKRHMAASFSRSVKNERGYCAHCLTLCGQPTIEMPLALKLLYLYDGDKKLKTADA
jgi:hypothetical protein